MTDENQTEVADESTEVESAEGADSEAADTPASEVDSALAERDRLKDQLLRTAADFDNFRKRTRRDLEEAERRGKEESIREILPIIDNLERAVAAAEEAPSAQAVAEGVEMVLRQFEDASQRIGLSRVASVGERFDPSIHDAVQQLETSDHPVGAVVAEVVPGYKLGDRLLRPAMVVVAKPPAAMSSSPPPEADAEEAD